MLHLFSTYIMCTLCILYLFQTTDSMTYQKSIIALTWISIVLLASFFPSCSRHVSWPQRCCSSRQSHAKCCSQNWQVHLKARLGLGSKLFLFLLQGKLQREDQVRIRLRLMRIIVTSCCCHLSYILYCLLPTHLSSDFWLTIWLQFFHPGTLGEQQIRSHDLFLFGKKTKEPNDWNKIRDDISK